MERTSDPRNVLDSTTDDGIISQCHYPMGRDSSWLRFPVALVTGLVSCLSQSCSFSESRDRRRLGQGKGRVWSCEGSLFLENLNDASLN